MNNQIQKSFIEKLLTKIDIVSLVESYVTLKKRGKEYVGICPFHNEKTASFTVNQTKQFYYCFGCGAHGNAIGFVMKHDHLEFVDAIKTLADKYGLDVQFEQDNKNTFDDIKPLFPIMEKAGQFFKNQLNLLIKNNPNHNAVKYLKSRGLSTKSIETFDIGFSSGEWDSLIKHFGADEKTKNELIRAGLIIQKDQYTFYDRFRERIMFPIRDMRGRVIAFGGRAISETSQPKYLNSPETEIFHKSKTLYGLFEAKKHDAIKKMIVVEGYMDVVMLAQNDISYCVATLGTAVSANHITQLFRLCDQVVFCFDGDSAGKSAASRALEIIIPLLKDNWQPRFLFLEEKEDPDSLVKKIGKNEFEKLSDNAISLPEFLFNQLRLDINLLRPDGRSKLISKAIPIIKKIPGDAFREILFEELSQLVKMDVQRLKNLYPDNKNPVEQYISHKKQPLSHKTLSNVQRFISLLLQYPNFINKIDENITSIQDPDWTLAEQITILIKQSTNTTTGMIIENWRGKNEEPLILKYATWPHLLSEKELLLEFTSITHQLKQQSIEYEVDNLMSKALSSGLSAAEKEKLNNLLKFRNKKAI